MLAPVFFILGVLSLQGGNARRCHISHNFQRYCGRHQNNFRISAEQCRAKCDADRNCLVGHWHPANHNLFHNSALNALTNCFLFRTDDSALKVCPWGAAATIAHHPGAKMIRCSATDDNDIERCYPSDNFERHCGHPVKLTFGENSERCRQMCNDMATCHVAHWHPGYQIWPNDGRSCCWMFPRGTSVCNWGGGGQLIKHHPGAQMFRCKLPTIKSFSYDIDAMAMMDSAPEVLGRIVITNHCPGAKLDRCASQSKKLIVSRSTTSTKSWSHTAGVSVTVGTKFQAGIPLVGKKEISVDVTASYEHTWGSTESETKTWSVHDNCVASAGVRLTCEFFVTKQRINVPFTIVWSTGEVTRGVYEGVDFFYGGTTATPEFIETRK